MLHLNPCWNFTSYCRHTSLSLVTFCKRVFGEDFSLKPSQTIQFVSFSLNLSKCSKIIHKMQKLQVFCVDFFYHAVCSYSHHSTILFRYHFKQFCCTARFIELFCPGSSIFLKLVYVFATFQFSYLDYNETLYHFVTC